MKNERQTEFREIIESAPELIIPTPDDIDEIFNMYVEKEKAFQIKGQKQWVNYTSKNRFPREFFIEQLKNGAMYAIRQNGKITAACVLKTEDKEMWGENENNDVYIKNFVSCKSGSGGVLLDLLSQKLAAAGVNSIKLDCNNDSTGLVQYYLSKGFVQKALRPYKSGTMSCLLSKDLR